MNLSLNNHWMRKALQLSLNEMAVLCEIYSLSNNTDYNGWCFKSKHKIGEILDLSKATVITICNTLEAKGYINRHPETKFLQPTNWIRHVAQEQENFAFMVKSDGFLVASAKMQSIIEEKKGGLESLPSVGNFTESVKKLDQVGKESLPKYNNSNTDSTNTKEIYKEKVISDAKSFYKNQIDVNEGSPHIEQYRSLANFLFASNPFGEPIYSILRVGQQLSYLDYIKLLSRGSYNHGYISDIMASLSNKDAYTKGKKNLFLIINNWIINDEKRSKK